jgi:hypothetical protein
MQLLSKVRGKVNTWNVENLDRELTNLKTYTQIRLLPLIFNTYWMLERIQPVQHNI